MNLSLAALSLPTVGGLPLHPLVVHATVILVPLACLAVIVQAWWPAGRRWLGYAPIGLASLAVALTLVTSNSGEQLEHRLPTTPLIHTHAELGDTLIWWVAPLWLVTLALTLADFRRRRTAANAHRQAATPVPSAVAGSSASTGNAVTGNAVMPNGEHNSGDSAEAGSQAFANGSRQAAAPAAASNALTRLKVSSRTWLALALVGTALAIGTTVQVVRIGHSGAQAVWEGTPTTDLPRPGG